MPDEITREEKSLLALLSVDDTQQTHTPQSAPPTCTRHCDQRLTHLRWPLRVSMAQSSSTRSASTTCASTPPLGCEMVVVGGKETAVGDDDDSRRRRSWQSQRGQKSSADAAVVEPQPRALPSSAFPQATPRFLCGPRAGYCSCDDFMHTQRRSLQSLIKYFFSTNPRVSPSSPFFVFSFPFSGLTHKYLPQHHYTSHLYSKI